MKPAPLLFALAACTVAGTAFAQNATAQALFDEGKRLVEEGRIAEACPKFLGSFKLDPKPGSAMRLADCYERNGQTASAWVQFLDAASLAHRAGQADREHYAREHAATLESKLSKLTVRAASPVPGLQILHDGVEIDSAAWGTAIPFDPGSHKIEATAPGKRPWSTTIQVSAASGTYTVDVPALEDATSRANAGKVPVATPAAAEPDPGSKQRVAGITVGALGIVGLGVGAVAGGIAASKWSAAKGHCNGTVCDADGVSDAGAAKTAGNVSTVALIAGAAALGVGIIVYQTAPKRHAKATGFLISTQVSPGAAGCSMRGEF
jgi:hypothetical protein